MVGDALADGGDGHQALLSHEAVEQLGVVHDLVGAADLRVLVAQRVEAVGAGDDDLLALVRRGVEHLVHHLDVLLRQHLEQELVARTPGRVAGARFALAEDQEVDGGHVEEFGDGLGGLLRPVLVGAGAADPEQVLEALERLDVLPEDGDLDVHLVDPGGTRGGVLAPRIALGLQLLEHAGELGGEVRFDEDLVAAHVEDVVDVFDVDGALFDARTAGGATPQCLGVDDRAERLGIEDTVLGDYGLAAAGGTLGFADELAGGLGTGRGRDGLELGLVGLAVGVEQTDLLTAHVGAATGQQVRRLGHAVVTQRHDQQLGRERLTGVPGGALRLAATAFGTGGEVEPGLPAEVLDPAGAEGVDVGVGGLRIQDLALAHHRLGRTQGDATVLLTLEVDVEERREPVPGHTPVEVRAHQQQEHAAREQLDQREDADHVGARGQQLGHLHGEEVGVGVVVVVGGDLAGLDEDHAQALDQHDRLDRVSGHEPRAGEP